MSLPDAGPANPDETPASSTLTMKNTTFVGKGEDWHTRLDRASRKTSIDELVLKGFEMDLAPEQSNRTDTGTESNRATWRTPVMTVVPARDAEAQNAGLTDGGVSS
jgi:hypothetical protein